MENAERKETASEVMTSVMRQRMMPRLEARRGGHGSGEAHLLVGHVEHRVVGAEEDVTKDPEGKALHAGNSNLRGGEGEGRERAGERAGRERGDAWHVILLLSSGRMTTYWAGVSG